MRAANAQRLSSREDYGAFDQLDGQHPWRDQVPEGLILYPVRTLPGGKVSYFNFELAKEMGLISKPRMLLCLLTTVPQDYLKVLPLPMVRTQSTPL